MCAVASRHIDKAESELPMHRIGLRRLQSQLDKLSLQILDELPHTIRGVGKAFGAHEAALFRLRKNPDTQDKYNRLAAKMGFIVTVRAQTIGNDVRPTSVAVQSPTCVGSPRVIVDPGARTAKLGTRCVYQLSKYQPCVVVKAMFPR